MKTHLCARTNLLRRERDRFCEHHPFDAFGARRRRQRPRVRVVVVPVNCAKEHRRKVKI